MPATGHKHLMGVVAWSIPDHGWKPAVLLACVRGVCAQTKAVMPSKRDRKVPEGLSQEQFDALKAGRYWPDIIGDAGV